MKPVVFVTSNIHKAEKLAALIGMEIEHQDVELVEIQSADVCAIAEYKVKQAYAALQRPVLVDDVALGFSALQGLPGPFIKYFVQAPNGLETLCRMLDAFPDRSATAEATLAYYDGTEVVYFSGKVTGTIAEHPVGEGGHGWDAIFCPDGHDGRTRAELDTHEYDAVHKMLRPIDDLRAYLHAHATDSTDDIAPRAVHEL